MREIKSLAEQLWNAEQSRIACAPIYPQFDNDIEIAYGIQKINIERKVANGARIVGNKIGLTARSVQLQLGVDQPDFGKLFADMAIVDGGEITWNRVMQPKVEAEVAFVLKKDLSESQHTIVDLINAIDYVLPAIEVVDSRIEDWQIKIGDTIADNASSGLFVLGSTPVKLANVDLLYCGMTLFKNGTLASVGAGMACLGNPLNALLWLADMLVKRGDPLQAGEIILSGALGPMVKVVPGDYVTASIEGLGDVSVRFCEEAI